MIAMRVLLTGQLGIERLSILERAVAVAANYGSRLYLVGGTVRDVLLGCPLIDVDVLMVGASKELPALVAAQLGGAVVSSSQFSTFKLSVHGKDFDLVIARKESYSYPGALPQVGPGSLDDDMARRDFTINAMALSLNEDTFGQIVDPFFGQEDLKAGLVKVLHERSFIDDATRILRAVRYAGRLGFRLDTKTETLVKRDLSYLDSISGDRIRHELERTLCESRFAAIIKLSQDLGVLKAVHPALTIDDRVLLRMKQAYAGPPMGLSAVRLSLLVWDVPEDSAASLVQRLNMDRRWSRIVADTVTLKSLTFKLNQPSIKPSHVYSLLHNLDIAAVQAALLVVEDENTRGYLKLYLEKLQNMRPILTGDDVMALGVEQGERVGQVLEALKVARLDNVVKTRQDEEAFVLRLLGS